MARAHAGEPRAGGASGAKRRSHSTRPRSVSIATTRSDGAPTKPRARNPRYPIKRSSSTGGVSSRAALASSARPSFQSSSNPGFRMRAAGPQLVAGLGVERVKDRMRGIPDANLGLVGAQAQIRRGLGGVLAAPVREDHSVGDDGGFGTVHVAGDPCRRELKTAIPLF